MVRNSRRLINHAQQATQRATSGVARCVVQLGVRDFPPRLETRPIAYPAFSYRRSVLFHFIHSRTAGQAERETEFGIAESARYLEGVPIGRASSPREGSLAIAARSCVCRDETAEALLRLRSTDRPKRPSQN